MKKIFIVLLTVFYCINGFAQDDAKIEKIAKEIVSNFQQKKYEPIRKDFNVEMKNALSAQKISEVWTEFTSKFGNFKSVISTSHNVVSGYKQIKTKCQFEKGVANIEVNFDGEGKVAGLWIRP